MSTAEIADLWLIRHGAVEAPKGADDPMIIGQLDWPLSARGRSQAYAMSTWCLRHCPRPALLASSDLMRCSAQAEILREAFEVPVQTSAALREQSLGHWQGQTWSALSQRADAEVRSYWADYARVSPPGGESLREMAERVGTWWRPIYRTHRDGCIVVVTHAGCIRALLCELLGMPLTAALRLAPPLGSISRIRVGDAGGVLELFGYVPHATEPAPLG